MLGVELGVRAEQNEEGRARHSALNSVLCLVPNWDSVKQYKSYFL